MGPFPLLSRGARLSLRLRRSPRRVEAGNSPAAVAMPTDAKKKAAVKTKEKEKKSARADKAERPKKKSDAAKKKSEPLALDPDAVQLFRRYDRARTGAMLRSDFLQLLRDYAHLPRTPHHGGSAASGPRPPLSLTDSRGIPLGYERAEKNSEFEAGQLFERYDRDHAGTLTLDRFVEFFRDFQAQLRAFADDLSYRAMSVQPLQQPGAAEAGPRKPVVTETPASNRDEESPPKQSPSTTSIRAQYQTTLWELRKVCKDELVQQRERIRDEINGLRERLAPTSRHEDRESDGFRRVWSPSGHHLDSFSFSPDSGSSKPRPSRSNQLLDRYDAMENDLERVDEVLRATRRQLRKGLDVTVDDMKVFLSTAPQLLAEARELVLKEYRSHTALPPSHRDERIMSPRKSRRPESPRDSGRVDVARPAAELSAAKVSPGPSDEHQATVAQLQKTLQVKDQLIYQLLQERTTLRRQKASVESDLHELTEVSTTEMRKWARLTDEMQDEIALLRDQLDTVNRRRENGSMLSYTSNAHA